MALTHCLHGCYGAAALQSRDLFFFSSAIDFIGDLEHFFCILLFLCILNFQQSGADCTFYVRSGIL